MPVAMPFYIWNYKDDADDRESASFDIMAEQLMSGFLDQLLFRIVSGAAIPTDGSMLVPPTVAPHDDELFNLIKWEAHHAVTWAGLHVALIVTDNAKRVPFGILDALDVDRMMGDFRHRLSVIAKRVPCASIFGLGTVVPSGNSAGAAAWTPVYSLVFSGMTPANILASVKVLGAGLVDSGREPGDDQGMFPLLDPIIRGHEMMDDWKPQIGGGVDLRALELRPELYTRERIAELEDWLLACPLEDRIFRFDDEGSRDLSLSALRDEHAKWRV